MPIINVIEYEGDNRTFVWKHPATDFNTKSQLIVHESQRALFLYEGKVQDVFGPGRYTLDTQNIPLLTAAGAVLISGGISPFHAEVYFINQAEQMGIAWGTNSKVQFMEPEFGFPLSIGASGEMALAVRDDERLLVRVVGTEAALSQDKLISYFKSFLQTRVKVALVQAIQEKRLNIFELDAHLDVLSGDVKERLRPDFAEYGIELTQFLVTTVARPEGDPIYERFRDLYFRQYADIREAQIEQQVGVINQETEAKRTVIEADASAERRRIEGYTYQQERGFDVAEKAAANEGAGGLSSMGIGLGMMAGVGVPVGSAVGGAVSEAMGRAFPGGSTAAAAAPVGAKFCPECGRPFQPTDKFCPECGTQRVPSVRQEARHAEGDQAQ